jgi:SMI1/KNR4 family protein SUKH-1
MVPFSYTRLEQYWRSMGLSPGVRAATGEIARFEVEHGVLLPPDVREYFLTVNGSGGGWDKDLWGFWPLNGLKTIPGYSLPEDGVPDPQRCFVFADHSIDVAFLAVQLSARAMEPAPVFCLWSRWKEVAPAFSEFWEAYLDGKEEVLFLS